LLRKAVAVAVAGALVVGGAAVLALNSGSGGDNRAAASEEGEVRLDGSGLPRASSRARAPEGRSPVVVEALPPGGLRRGGGAEGDDEPPRRVVEENARLRRELKHLKALERERAGVARALAAADYGGPLLGSGELAWPVTGSVVSPFGQRWGRLHAGIDIAAGSGTPIQAAEAGRVVIRGQVGGYGNYVCVQHTARLTSCYAHLSRFLTRRGAAVEQGEVIGLVGCTGHCFGDHLHFETWVGGRPVDPMRYL
jgi:murein DD-endopeptidase MepM/ murein hydrolase activator NlpD